MKKQRIAKVLSSLIVLFYDIRRDIENSGILDVPTESHRIDQKDINRYVDIIKIRVEELNKSLKAIEKVMHQDREQFYVEKNWCVICT